MANKKIPVKVTNLLLNPTKLKNKLHEVGSMDKLAKELGVCRNTIKSYCDQAGIKTLKQGRPFELTVEQRKENYEKLKKKQIEQRKEKGRVVIIPRLEKDVIEKLDKLYTKSKKTYEDVLLSLYENFKNKKDKKPLSFGLITAIIESKPIIVNEKFRETLKEESKALNLTMGEYISLLIFNA